LVAPPYVAVIDTPVFAVTAVGVIVKAAEVAPAATVTVVGGEATTALLLVSITIAPPAGAGPLSVTVTLVVEPPFIEVAPSFRDASAGGFTVSTADLDAPL
jgi:hypothetical protein